MSAVVGSTDLGVRVKPFDSVPPAEWDAYVAAHPEGSAFHTTAMARCFAAVPKHFPRGYAAVSSQGQIVAILMATRIETLGGLASRIASRGVWYAEPLCDNTPVGREGLHQIVRAYDRDMGPRCVFTEIRPLQMPGAERDAMESYGYQLLDYLNFVVDTTDREDVIWERMRKSARQKIRRSLKRGVTIELDNTHEGVRRMYRLVVESYRRSQVPLAAEALFHAAFDEFETGVVQVRLARYQGQDVAGGIALMFGGRFYAWYGGALRLQGLAPFDCLTWDEISWAARNGGRCYDFGGAGWPDEDYGPRDFKAKFGGELTHFGRYRKVHSRWKFLLADTAYQKLRGFLSPQKDGNGGS